ncbi:aminomethyl-transferring glycine dehydrogenase subunit GcvPA [Roseospira visakhapatnamensis]|uniref:Probable glycine dehydrogenase (decarboxylating) subunit 1 n=1 Tax=Roseospira visakhapatnamensis TaxID=390880 RepID=A0A7W6RDN3_9PROT|nr:aminomethyl-transferring glycine dehydrogenase subunit GcvPA [Roseospira visakhapatnamensis]MBB4266146.1 glycine dehydrogenase subunit 1 [Roseospira visakhapatnamensis]
MRYLPLTDGDRRAMLARIGAASVDDLFRDVPDEALAAARFDDLPDHATEMAVERQLSALAARNRAAGAGPCFLGAGAYRHHVPAAVDHLIQRGEFLTAYTPYQPEVSQGTLQYLYEFQTQVALITGMEVANASMYDAATGVAEAAAMACRITRRKHVLLSGGLHPHYGDVTGTFLRYTDVAVERLAPDPLGVEDRMGRVTGETACVIVQNPDVFGRLADLSALARDCHAQGALLVVAVAEPVSLGLVTPPGAMGADIVVAEGHAIGSPLTFGGPGVGLFATRQKFLRHMPGRLSGETVDEDGRRGWVLTLSTREQHIRREKATSNICTNSGLIALAWTIHMTLLGEAGFTRLARLNHQAAVALVERLERVPGLTVVTPTFFNEVLVRLPGRDAAAVVETLAARGVLAGVPLARFWPTWPELADGLLICATETNTDADMDALVAALTEALQ